MYLEREKNDANLSRPVLITEAEGPPSKLAIRGLSLTRNGRVILDDIFLEVGTGETLGVLGAAGSGKSTLVHCVTGLCKADMGTLWLEGSPKSPSDFLFRSKAGVVYQDSSLEPTLTAFDNLVFGGQLFGLGRSEVRKRADELLGFMDLREQRNLRVENLSLSMQRRLEIARTLIHSPEILVLDEPTVGLESGDFDKIWQLLGYLQEQENLSILVTTDWAAEAAKCHRLVIFDRGHVVCIEEPSSLMDNVSGEVLSIKTRQPSFLKTYLEEATGMYPQIIDGAVELQIENAHQWLERVVDFLPDGSFDSLLVRKANLADAFLNLTGRGLNYRGS
ncbi:MAG: ATP-binding cassette domain-containing protein [Myxococcota bacterium]|nr:ATP-binding cassette domain-containing protein [Myxococcota bacterium]